MICCYNLQKQNLFNSVKRELNKGFNDTLLFGEEWYYINTKSNTTKHLPIKYKYMGYYTWYTLEILKDPDNQEELFWEDFEEKTKYSSGEFQNFNTMEAKWYNWEEDMIELSRKFPKMLFKLEGEGEEPLDIWIAHFCNGQGNYREIQTYWEEFNPEEFYNNNKS